MKNLIYLVVCIAIFSSCKKYLDPDEYGILSKDKVYAISTYVDNIPFGIYSKIPLKSDVSLAAAADEAENVNANDASQEFNKGTWYANSTGDNVWSSCYQGVRMACDYLKETETLDWSQYKSNKAIYLTRIRALSIGRGEARFLRAYLYFELMKRYGSVPLIKDKVDIVPNMDYSQFTLAPVSDIVDFIIDECDVVSSEGKYKLTDEQKAQLTENGTKYIPIPYRDTIPTLYDLNGPNSAELGRATKAAALALKAKVLVYYASPMFNAENLAARWQAAAAACKKVLNLPGSHYGLEANYADVFNRKSAWSKEFIFVKKAAASQTFEMQNFPVLLSGGATGTCPSQDLVDAYEVKVNASTAVPFDWNNPQHTANPYANRDPRLAATTYYNGVQYYTASPNNKTLEIWAGGNSDPAKFQTSKTGYYLKKYIDPSLDLSKTASTSTKTWVLMRMADFYLYYAEAMNEAYGSPDADPAGLGMTARQAINVVRTRAGMPAIPSTSQIDFRTRLQNERRVELAFENNRWWDVRRWMLGDQYFNADLHKISITKVGSTFTYAKGLLEKRVYDQSKMKFYKISPTELSKMGRTD